MYWPNIEPEALDACDWRSQTAINLFVYESAVEYLYKYIDEPLPESVLCVCSTLSVLVCLYSKVSFSHG